MAIQEARTALGLAWRYMDAFETDAAALYAAPMELNEMRDFAARLVKADDKTASVTARRVSQQQASSIVKLWTSSPLPTAEPTITPLTCADAAITCSRRWLGVGCSACPKTSICNLVSALERHGSR